MRIRLRHRGQCLCRDRGACPTSFSRTWGQMPRFCYATNSPPNHVCSQMSRCHSEPRSCPSGRSLYLDVDPNETPNEPRCRESKQSVGGHKVPEKVAMTTKNDGLETGARQNSLEVTIAGGAEPSFPDRDERRSLASATDTFPAIKRSETAR